jgi:hypothetical protein
MQLSRGWRSFRWQSLSYLRFRKPQGVHYLFFGKRLLELSRLNCLMLAWIPSR